MKYKCPQCGSEEDVSNNISGEKIKCGKCAFIFLVEENVNSPKEPSPEQGQNEELEIVEDASATKKCPFCAEIIKAEAKKCRFCNEIIDRDLAIAKKQEKLAYLKRRRDIYVAGFSTEAPNARAAMWCGILALCCFGLITGIPAILLGMSAKKHIKAKPHLTGAGMAKAGIIMGWISVALSIIMTIYVYKGVQEAKDEMNKNPQKIERGYDDEQSDDNE